jgi:hypothetical protein
MATEFLDLPVINPAEHPLLVSTELSDFTAPPEQTHMHRYVRTLHATTQLGLGLEEILTITEAELDKLRQLGVPVLSPDWCYYPKEAALAERKTGLDFGVKSPGNFLVNTSYYLEPRIPKEFLLAAQVPIIDKQKPPIDRQAATWVDTYHASSEAGNYRLSDLDPKKPNKQFLYGHNRATGIVAEWLVDIEPIIKRA